MEKRKVLAQFSREGLIEEIELGVCLGRVCRKEKRKEQDIPGEGNDI